MMRPRSAGRVGSRAASAFGFVGLAGLSLAAACGGDGGDTFVPSPDEGVSCAARGCASGVRVEVPALAALGAEPGPVKFRLCFDASCTDLALRGGERAPSCEVVGALAGDQFASCYASGAGALTFEVVRIDGRPYDGARPVVALSARDVNGELLFHDAAEVPLEPVYANGPSCGSTCAQGAVTFAGRVGRD